jgi:hypothetical protein
MPPQTRARTNKRATGVFLGAFFIGKLCRGGARGEMLFSMPRAGALFGRKDVDLNGASLHHLPRANLAGFA